MDFQAHFTDNVGRHGSAIHQLAVLFLPIAWGGRPHWLEDSSSVSVQRTGDFYGFTPTGPYNKVLLFYPGAMVESKAYVPLCRQIADHGV